MTERSYASTACPYCGVRPDPLPRAKSRCRACGQPIWVRKGPDGLTYLLQEGDLPVLEQAWADHRVEQQWRERTEALLGAQDTTRLAADMRARDPAYTARDIYWAAANRDVLAKLEAGDWHELKMAYLDMAVAAWDEADDEADASGAEPDAARALRLIREADLAELRDLMLVGVSRVAILGDGCPGCTQGIGLVLSAQGELDQPLLPHAACRDGFCRCEYVST